MKYAPKNLNLKPADYGFTVLRTYEAVDDPEDVTQDADGKWIFKAGARVRVSLTMVAQARRYHVALVDPLPAGLEILNPGLAVTEVIPPDIGDGNTPVIEYGSRSYGRGYYYWRSQWFEHQNFRDERAEAFTSSALGRSLQLHLRCQSNNAGTIRRAASQSRRNVSSRNLRPNGNGFCESQIM